MTYGLENFIYNPPFSLISSIILSFGVAFIGQNFNRILLVKIMNYEYKNYFIFFSTISGTYILIFLCYLFILLDVLSIYVFKSISFLIFCAGIFNLIVFIKFFKKKIGPNLLNSYLSKENLLVSIILIFLFFISASPITHADSLNYHVAGAINLLNNGKLFGEILPIEFFLVSIGEILISIGLVAGAEQFGSIIQFTSLFSLIPLLKVFSKKEKLGKYIYLIIITTPISIFLISSPKPQLLFALSTSIIFFISFKYLKNFNNKNIKLFFVLSMIVLSINFLVKYSFILSSFLIGLLIFIKMYERKLILFSINSFLLIFFIIIFPFLYIKFDNFEYSILSQIFLSPLPINIYGFQKFHNLLTIGELSLLQLIIPRSLGEFSTIYGPSLILIFYMINKKIFKNLHYFLIVIIFLIIAFFKGSNLPRFLFEGFIWLNIFTYIIFNNDKKKLEIFKFFTYTQSMIMGLVILIFAGKLFPGSLSSELREKIMQGNAKGYSLAVWTNSQINDDDILISTHNSISLFNVRTISTLFTWVTKFEEKDSIIFADNLKNIKTNKILFYGKKLDTEPFSGCLGKLINHKEIIGKKVGRNPFNAGQEYGAWLFEFNYKKLPKCLSP